MSAGGGIFIDQRTSITYMQTRGERDAPGQPPGALSELVEPVGEGALPMVADLDPYRLGVTPSAFGRPGEYGKRDPYVPRTVDKKLASALAGNQMVLLVGPSKSGKTRTLFEAVRAHAPRARLISPLPGALSRIAAHPQFKQIPDPVVVWLDDVDRFLVPPDPLSPALLTRLKDRTGPTTVVATLRTKERERLYRNTGELNRDTRMLLDNSAEVPLSTTLDDPAERDAAMRLYRGQLFYRFGLGAVLAGAPDVLRYYDATKDDDPLQRAAIEVAIDWARVGRPGPIMEPSLARVSTDRCRSMHPELDVSKQQMTDAIKLARTPLPGAGGVAPLLTSLLGDQRRGYRPFDYLVAADDGQDHAERRIPETFWDQAIRDATTDEAFAIGSAAYQRGSYQHAMKAMLVAADGGNTSAMINLGILLSKVWSPPDLPTARTWFEKAAAAGNTDAMFALGYLLALQWSPPDLPTARAWLEKAAAAGDTNAMSTLGKVLANRWDPPDLPTARAWLEKAAAAGNTDAMIALGNLLALQWSPPDLPTARTWYERAAAVGNTIGMIALGNLLTQRWSPPDLPTGRAWYERAAAGGDATAMYNLGFLLTHQWSPPDLPTGRAWLEKAADAGKTNAMFHLGLLLTQQWSPPDLPTGRAWYEKAAAAGNTDAMVNLGSLLIQQWSPPDLPAARTWWEKAADAGNIQAMKSLAWLLTECLDPPDRESARTWLRRAADAGDADAANSLAI